MTKRDAQLNEKKDTVMYIIMNTDGKYYTNDQRQFEGRYPFLWTSHKRLAKQYAKQGWAEKIAKKFGGNALRAQ